MRFFFSCIPAQRQLVLDHCSPEQKAILECTLVNAQNAKKNAMDLGVTYNLTDIGVSARVPAGGRFCGDNDQQHDARMVYGTAKHAACIAFEAAHNELLRTSRSYEEAWDRAQPPPVQLANPASLASILQVLSNNTSSAAQ